MLPNCIGLDKDGISFDEAKQLEQKIIKEQKCQVILYKTKRGFHLILIYNTNISRDKNFAVRKKYGDCKERIRRSLLRPDDVPYDILFSIKDGHWRKRILF